MARVKPQFEAAEIQLAEAFKAFLQHLAVWIGTGLLQALRE